jgi:hypothetical protein
LPRKPQFAAAHRDVIDTLEGIDYVEAKKFTLFLWYSLRSLRNHDLIYDSNIEECIAKSLKNTAKNYEYANGLTIKHKHWPFVTKIAKEMIKAQFDNSTYHSEFWFDQLRRKLDW